MQVPITRKTTLSLRGYTEKAAKDLFNLVRKLIQKQKILNPSHAEKLDFCQKKC